MIQTSIPSVQSFCAVKTFFIIFIKNLLKGNKPWCKMLCISNFRLVTIYYSLFTKSYAR